MKIGLQEIDWKYIGSVLANLGDNEQAEFFKAFVNECLTWGTRYQVSIQLASVNRLLNKKEIEILGQLTYDEGGDKLESKRSNKDD